VSQPPSSIAALNARARALGVTEEVHGVSIADPYRALEQRSELTNAWIDAQTQRTEQALAALGNEARDKRLAQLLSIGSIGDLAVGGSRVFAMVREGQREQAALYVLPSAAPSAALPAPLLDPLTHGERAAIDYIYPSPSGRYVALGLSHNGDERSVLLVVDADSGALLSERIAHAKWSSVAWLGDDSGFYYTRYPVEGEPQYDPKEPDAYFPLALFHRLGSDHKGDSVVWRSTVATDFPFIGVSDDDRYVLLHNQRSWTATDVWLFDRGKKTKVQVPDAQHPLVPITVGIEKQTYANVHRGQLYLLTNIGADRRRVVIAPIASPAEQSQWRNVVPEGPGTIDAWAIARDRLLVHRVEEVRSRLTSFGLEGKDARDLPLPSAGTVSSLSADAHSGTLAYTFSSFFYAPALFAGPAHAEQKPPASPQRIYQVQHDVDTSPLELTQLKASSKDGTAIPVTLVHRRDWTKNADNPVLLTGYGGFDVSLMPEFTRNALYWLERGGVYAVANLRGGGEYGESWHRAGMLEQKVHVFEDFEAVLRLLSESRISRPERIAIVGGSNGGLLVAAAVTRAPATFAAAVAEVGLYDMLRYHLFPPAQIWATEYGDPKEPAAARWLAAYSPYHHVAERAHYPAVLIETADHDTRVHWAHSTKLAARLQDAQAGNRPIYFYMEREQGHGSGTRLRDLVREHSRKYAFIESQLGAK
jgi:prolyl oligopeptidase